MASKTEPRCVWRCVSCDIDMFKEYKEYVAAHPWTLKNMKTYIHPELMCEECMDDLPAVRAFNSRNAKV